MNKNKCFITMVSSLIILSLSINIINETHKNKLKSKISNIKNENNILKNNLGNIRKDINTKTEKIKYHEEMIKMSKKDFKNGMINSFNHLKSNVDPIVMDKIIDSIIIESNKNDIPALLILCLMFQESSFNHLASNSLNATGLMQIVPKYHQDKIDKFGIENNELFHIDNNIMIGVLILKDYFDSSENIIEALQKYVGASTKNNASKYIENILNYYISLQMIYF